MHKTQLKHKRTCFVIARDIDLYALAVALLAEHLSKRNGHWALKRVSWGLWNRATYRRSREKREGASRLFAGLFLVNVMENAKSLSCSLFLPLSLSSSFFTIFLLTGAMCQCGIADFSGLNWVKRALSLHLGGSLTRVWDIGPCVAGPCLALLTNAVEGHLTSPFFFNT